MLWDAIVLGAGPAGISAALTLHRAGRRVLLLDRKQFPRPKACAGMLSASAMAAAPCSLAPAICGVSRNVRVQRNGQALLQVERNILTHRMELDTHLFRQAVQAGVPFRQASGPARLTDTGQSLRLITGRHELFLARTLIAADGANSAARRLLGLAPASRQAFSVELDLPVRADASSTPAFFDFDAVQDGYGWWFPKGASSNYGIAFMRGLGEQPAIRLAAFLDKIGVAHPADVQMRGAAIGAFGAATLLGKGNVLLCGDAAGLADPLTGEGISQAFRSGRAAALAVDQATQPGEALALYTTQLQGLLATLLRRSAPPGGSFSYGAAAPL